MNRLLANAVSVLTNSATFVGFQAAQGRQLLSSINAWEMQLQERSLDQLRKICLALRYRAKSGESLLRLLPETYALVREASRRTIGLRHFDVQMLGGIALHFRSITEMQTGEGKTLTATLPMTLAALPGKGAHLATVNDYLARRDAEWMRPVYECLGLSVGVVESQSSATERRTAYACDITYGTAKEFGFDFLRDRLIHREADEAGTGLVALLTGEAPAQLPSVQRGHFFALVDEADNVLIDDAGTPLIISAVPSQSQRSEAEAYLFAATAAGHFVEQDHYEYNDDRRSVELTPAGQRLARSLKQPEALLNWSWVTLYEYLERAIRVRRDFHKDRHYVVRDGEIVIVDEFTGRLAEGRKWRSGIHQAVEAQEELEVTVDAGQSAQITVQDYFRRYQHVAGMTGTASTSATELKKIYGLRVCVVPTNRPAIRRELPTAIFADHHAKWSAVVEEIQEFHTLGRPVLIGTRSIDQSMHLSRLLTEAVIEHQVLNAHQIAAEAEIIARAGEPGSVTVSTNMAGRGTDIRLGVGVTERGGLHVIATEMHEAARIDRQLRGRCGRQGDPGTYRQYLALDDELLQSGLGPSAAERILRRYAGQSGELSASLLRLFHRAQRRVEKRQFQQRKTLLHFDQQRRKIQREMGQDPYLDSLG
ncbi:MAG: preprotein translocase subunit SecA [Planctomycetes bacterium]|nr:preprotein translocase subunit SecA [Planctomycetota bacterium]